MMTTHSNKHLQQVQMQLRKLGVSSYALIHKECRYLPTLLHQNEEIGGVLYGHYRGGFAMLVATDRRIIFLDNKPMFVNEDEISYNVVSGVSHNQVGFAATVTLHTRIKDYSLRTYNTKCALGFVEYIEKRCLENKDLRKNFYDTPPQNWSL